MSARKTDEKKKNKKALKEAAKSAVSEPVPEPVEGSEADYQAFLADAMKLAPADVMPFKADASLAYHNVAAGVSAVLARKADVLAELPNEDIDALSSLPNLALGTVYAALLVDHGADASNLSAMLAEARGLRHLLLKAADALAAAGVIKASKVDAIRAGRGKLDAARDCTALAALFGDKSLLAKTPLTKAHVARAAVLGAELQTLLKPTSAKRSYKAPEDVQKTMDVRNRFWTLLAKRHERLWSVGAILWGHAVDDHVPALQGRATKGSLATQAAKAEKAAAKAQAKAAKAQAKAAAKEAKKNGGNNGGGGDGSGGGGGGGGAPPPAQTS